MTSQSNSNSAFGTFLKWGAGGVIVWKIPRPEVRNGIREFVNELAAYHQYQAKLERLKIIQEVWNETIAELTESIKNNNLTSIPVTSQDRIVNLVEISPSSPTIPSLNLFSKQPLETDNYWRKIIVRPSVVVILGKRGSGKSALGYRLLELLRYAANSVYVVGAPQNACSLLPQWIGIVPSLEDLPANCVALADEANLTYHARGSMTAKSKTMSKALNLSRQKELTCPQVGTHL
jgi:ABC-type multidrug transport system fused ATPase/permease subunit